MTNIRKFIPRHERIRALAQSFSKDIPDENSRERVAAYFNGYCNAVYQDICEQYEGELTQQEHLLLTEIAFWKGVYNLLRRDAKFVIADKIGFIPPDEKGVTAGR